MMNLGPVLKQKIHLNVCCSTNDKLKELLRVNENPEELSGYYVTAGYQTRGRGHNKNRWHSSRDANILMSFLATPPGLPAGWQFDIARHVSLVLVDFIGMITGNRTNVKIKWPNDIICNDKKIAGMLIENRIMGEYVVNSIIGVGININEDHFPDEFNMATSVKCVSGREMDVKTAMEKWIMMLKAASGHDQASPDLLHQQYDEVLFGLNRKLTFTRDDRQVFEGVIQGTDRCGMLRIMTAEGERKFGFKEVVFLY